jgi:hypothetical protein
MTVYIDDVGHRFKHMIMCHMWADTLDELLQMAEAVGIAAKWLQGPPKSSWLHFDIPVDLKPEVINRGARLTDRFGPVEHLARLRGDDECLATIARARSLRGLPIDGFLETG